MPGTEEEKVQNDINQAALTDPNFAAAIMNLTDEEKLNMYRDYIKRINNDLRGLSAGKTAGTLTTANTLGDVAQQQMTADALRRKKEEEENKLGYGSSGPNRNPVYT